MYSLLLTLDPLLIAPYRFTGEALSGFLLGTTMLCVWCIVLGDAASIVVSRFNRKRLIELQRDMEHHHKLSETALRMGDKESFKAVNKQGHDAFGYYFSMGAALFCSSIWPLPFALGWMDGRFNGATPTLPWDVWLIGQQPTVVFWFLFLYIPLRMVYAGYMSRWAWYNNLRGLQHKVDIATHPGV